MRAGLLLLPCFVFVTMAGCATYGQKFKQTEKQPVSLEMVRKDSAANIARNVIWGGRVVSVINKQDNTRLEIIAYPLNYAQKPVAKASPGRFIAFKQGYLESLDYVDQLVTIQGKIEGMENNISNSHVDDQDYQFPVVEIKKIRIWPVVNEPRVRFNFGFVFRN